MQFDLGQTVEFTLCGETRTNKMAIHNFLKQPLINGLHFSSIRNCSCKLIGPNLKIVTYLVLLKVVGITAISDLLLIVILINSRIVNPKSFN